MLMVSYQVKINLEECLLLILSSLSEGFTLDLSFYRIKTLDKTSSFNIQMMERGHAKEMMCSLTLGTQMLLSGCLSSIRVSVRLSALSRLKMFLVQRLSVSSVVCHLIFALQRAALAKQVTGQRGDIEQF